MIRGRIPLTINGRFLAQPTTGVQRVARELSREIDALVASGEAEFDVRLVCPPDIVRSLRPENQQPAEAKDKK